MATETKVELDSTDIHILEELQLNARISMAELGRRVALSPPAVADRVRRMEDEGVIEGYAARVNTRKLGYGMQAIVTVTAQHDSPGFAARLAEALKAFPEVLAFFVVTGPDCGFVRVAVRDTQHLSDLLERLKAYGRTDTSVVLSTPIPGRPILPPVEG